MKDATQVMKEFFQEYQKDPSSWSFWMSPPSDPEDFYDTYITHGDEAYFLKTDSIYTPNPIGKGAKMKIEEGQFEDDLPDFGFRKFSPREVQKFFRNLPRPDEYESEEEFKEALKESRKDFDRKAIRKKPVPFQPPSRSGEMAAIGPFSSGNPLNYVSDKQKELDKKLSEELRQLKEREHPGYG